MLVFDAIDESTKNEILFSEYADGSQNCTDNGIYLDDQLFKGRGKNRKSMMIVWIFKESVMFRMQDGTYGIADREEIARDGWKA